MTTLDPWPPPTASSWTQMSKENNFLRPKVVFRENWTEMIYLISIQLISPSFLVFQFRHKEMKLDSDIVFFHLKKTILSISN